MIVCYCEYLDFALPLSYSNNYNYNTQLQNNFSKTCKCVYYIYNGAYSFKLHNTFYFYFFCNVCSK